MIKCVQTLLLVCAFVCQSTLAQTVYENSVIQVEDIVYSDQNGYISQSTSHSYGNVSTKIMNYVTSSGYEMKMIIPPGAKNLILLTPGADFQFTVTNPSTVLVKSLTTGEVRYVYKPASGWPTDAPIISGPKEPWQEDMERLLAAFQNSLDPNTTRMVNPLRKYQDLGVLESTSVFPAACTSESCKLNVVLAGANLVGGVISCVTAGSLITAGGCALAMAALPVTVGAAIDQCSCNVTPTPPNNASPVDNDSPFSSGGSFSDHAEPPPFYWLKCAQVATTGVVFASGYVFDQSVCTAFLPVRGSGG